MSNIDFLSNALHLVYDVRTLVTWGGIGLIGLIIFVETGFFLGFFLPGDSLLVTAGIFAAAGYLNIWQLLILLPICAIVGDQLNYYVGKKAGKALFQREDSLFFHKHHLEKARQFYDAHGPKTIVLARFVPIVRTFAPAIAGVAEMHYGKFITYNIFGGFIWVWSMLISGYSLASLIPNINDYIHVVVGVVILLSLLPLIFEYVKHKRMK